MSKKKINIAVSQSSIEMKSDQLCRVIDVFGGLIVIELFVVILLLVFK